MGADTRGGTFWGGGGEVPPGNSVANIVLNCYLCKLVGEIFSGNWKKRFNFVAVYESNGYELIK